MTITCQLNVILQFCAKTRHRCKFICYHKHIRFGHQQVLTKIIKLIQIPMFSHMHFCGRCPHPVVSGKQQWISRDCVWGQLILWWSAKRSALSTIKSKLTVMPDLRAREAEKTIGIYADKEDHTLSRWCNRSS